MEQDRKADFIQAKSRSGAKCYSILIGSQTTETLRQFSDRIFSLSTTPTAKEGGEILADIYNDKNLLWGVGH
jgi:hypothetical protein